MTYYNYALNTKISKQNAIFLSKFFLQIFSFEDFLLCSNVIRVIWGKSTSKYNILKLP